MNTFLGTCQGFSSQLGNSYAIQQLSFKTPLHDYRQLLNLLWLEPCRVMSVYESKIQDIKKKFSSQ